MIQNKLVAIFMVAIMTLSVVGVAFAGGVAASENVRFDGEAVPDYDQTNETVLPSDYTGENVTIRFTDTVSLTEGDTETYSSQDGWIVDYEVDVTEMSMDPEYNTSLVDGNLEIEAVSGDIDVSEVNVTVAADSIPFVVGSENQSPVSDASSTTAWWYSEATDGERLALGAEHTEDFFLGVHETDENGDPITEDENGNFTSLGTSAEMEAGEYWSLNVDLDEELEESTELVAVLYNSDDGDIGEPVTDDSDNMVTSTTWEPDIQDQIPSSNQLGSGWHLVDTPNGEEQAYNIYDPEEVVNIEYSVDNGEFNDGVYEPNETGEEAHFEVNITRNGTAYEDLDLSNLQLTLGLNENVFQNIEDVTELDSDVLTLDRIEDEEQPKSYVFNVEDTASLDTYTLEMTGEVTAANSDDAVVVGADIDPTGGPEVSDTESYEIDEGADAPMFTEGLDNPSGIATAILGALSIGLVGLVGYKKNVFSGIRNREAEAFGIVAAGAVVIVSAAEAISGNGIVFGRIFEMAGVQVEAWILALVALAVAGVVGGLTLDEDDYPTR